MNIRDSVRHTLNSIHKEILRRQESGELKTYLGGYAYVILLQDKLERVLRSGNLLTDELVDAATDAVLALHIAVSKGLEQQLNEIEEEPEEVEEEIEEELEPEL